MHSAPKIWCTFFGLVIWAAIHISQIEELMYYMDDVWSYDMNPDLTYYAPYDSFYPSKQVTLLQLYDEVGLPHVRSKQLFGHSLEIIGLYVDPSIMTISMSVESWSTLVMAICAFIDTSTSRKRPLLEWQWILGWINLGLNAYPLLHPCLHSSYAKIVGKCFAQGPMYLNRVVIRHFTWLAETIKVSDGIHMLDALSGQNLMLTLSSIAMPH